MELARLVPLILLAACAATPDEPFDPTTSTVMLELEDGQVISGRLGARKITVPEGATVRYEGDTTLYAEWICVHGALLGDSPFPDGPPAGAGPDDIAFAPGKLRLEATREIHFSPESRWRGDDPPSMGDWPAPFRGVGAGDGGSLELVAPSILSDGALVAGHGGEAAPGGEGGDGGGIHWRGEFTAFEGGGEGQRGGNGGMCGRARDAETIDGVAYPRVEAGDGGSGGGGGPLPEDEVASDDEH